MKSKKIKLLKPFAKEGIGLHQLNNLIQNSTPDKNVKILFISIGVNDNYNNNGISSFAKNLYIKFPNSIFYIIKGSYGWGNVKKITNKTKRYIEFYDKFKKEGVFVIDEDGGNGNPHSNKWNYTPLVNIIDNLATKKQLN